MMSAQDAQEALQAAEDPRAAEKRRDAARELPPELREVAYGLLMLDPSGQPVAFNQALEAGDQAVRRLLALDEAPRRAVLDTVFAGLGPYVAHALCFLGRLPNVGEGGLPFRVPPDHPASVEAQTTWLRWQVGLLLEWPDDPRWLAELGSHNFGLGQFMGPLLAAAVELGGEVGDAVYDILVATARGEHPVARMGQHVAEGLLIAERPEGWAALERVLLAAQREEGLRHSILVATGRAHPLAFRRLARTILEHDLLRFSAVLQMVDTWLGLAWDVNAARAAADALATALACLEDEARRRELLAGGDGPELYLALWATAFEDATVAVAEAAARLDDADPARRFAALQVAVLTGLPEAQPLVLRALGDADLRVAALALAHLGSADDPAEAMVAALGGPRRAKRRRGEGPSEAANARADALESLAQRLPEEPKELQPLVWPWSGQTISRAAALSRLVNEDDLPLERLLPHLPALDAYGRHHLALRLHRDPALARRHLDQVIGFLSDRSSDVRGTALGTLREVSITPAAAPALEPLLARQSADLRRGLIELLLRLDAPAVLASADRLLAAKKKPLQVAGLELLRELCERGDEVAACRARAEAWRAAHPQPDATEAAHLEAIGGGGEAATLDDALGLAPAAERTPPAQPRERDGLRLTPTIERVQASLVAEIERHADTLVPLETYDGGLEDQPLLVGLRWFCNRLESPSAAEREPEPPLAEVWRAWDAARPGSLRDPDGLELVRALASRRILQMWFILPWLRDEAITPPDWAQDLVPAAQAETERLELAVLLEPFLLWLIRQDPPPGLASWVLDMFETAAARTPTAGMGEPPDPDADLSYPASLPGWRGVAWPTERWREVAVHLQRQVPQAWSQDEVSRLWRLLRWFDEPLGAGTEPLRERPLWAFTLAALRAGAATDADLCDQLIGRRSAAGARFASGHFLELQATTTRKPPVELIELPHLAELVDRCRRRVLEVEAARGDQPTVATDAAEALACVPGAEWLAKALAALGKANLVRGWDRANKPAVLSHLVRVSLPAEGETDESFAAALAATGVGETRLVETAVYAPQWAGFVERYLGWPGLEDGVWWMHAHTKDELWSVEQELRELWTAEAAERTPLSAQDLLDGAVDVAWFRRLEQQLGQDRWATIRDAAKYASSGSGHARARLFADTLTGRETAESLLPRITGPRNKDAVRALGLAPLPEGRERRAEVLRRYEVLQEFLRGSRKFGAQRRESEARAVAIGLDNLARTAGYPDPIRLQWAMEREAVADLAAGPLVATFEDYTITLSIDPTGAPELTVERGEKTLQSVPAKAKKDPAVAALTGRVKTLKEQSRRMRGALEQAMIRGDVFDGDELAELMGHPLLAPMLRALVFVSESGDAEAPVGYPTHDGRALTDHAGELRPVGGEEPLRVAHPHDLLSRGDWHLWQRECFTAERVQPFKQVFRELYPLTDAERAAGTVSHRYDGHQIQPRQALALFTSRGWVSHPEEGLRKVFHDADVAAWVGGVDPWWTPAEVENPTLEGVQFTRHAQWAPLPLDQVPPRLFSEVMRDLDLVVSVAHAGGVDPEASASTVDLRAALLRELVCLLKLSNVTLQEHYALIDGQRAKYRVHLGSGVCHLRPGGMLCIIPVPGQHRGRLFLPFADDDPKTAEVLSKVLMLANDDKLRDPVVLDQLR